MFISSSPQMHLKLTFEDSIKNIDFIFHMTKGLHNTAEEFLVLAPLEMKLLAEVAAHPCNPRTQKTAADVCCACGVSLGHAAVLGQPCCKAKPNRNFN